MRTACGLALFLAAWAGGLARADEKSPPPPRFLSLAEARALALEKATAGRAAGRSRVLAVSTSRGREFSSWSPASPWPRPNASSA